MSIHYRSSYCVLVLALACLCLRAEDAPKITVNAAGSAKLVPAALEAILTLKEKAPDAKSAVAALKAARDKAVAKIGAAGYPTDQVKDDPFAIVDKTQADLAKKMAAMRGGNRLKRTKKEDEKLEVDMQQVIRIRIPFKGKDLASVTIEAEEIKAKLKAAKLLEEKDGENADENEDENMAMYNMYNNQGQQNQGPLVFMFFAPVADNARELAMAEAIKKAKESAARTAKAMEITKAPFLRSVVVQSEGDEQALNYAMYGYAYNAWGAQAAQPQAQDGMLSATPNMTLRAQIVAEFSIDFNK